MLSRLAVRTLFLCLAALAPSCAYAARPGDLARPALPGGKALPAAPEPAAADDAADPAAGSGIMLAHRQGSILIPRLDTAPKFEDFLGDPGRSPVARQMLRISRFIERSPEDGNLPSSPTVAYLGYTHDAFFAAFVCTDRDPGLIRAHMLARDSLGDDDNVSLYLDTFDDQRRAFVFQSNPLGIQSDSLYSEQTGWDSSFDTVWDTWGKRTRTGYVVLFRIPFASLYFAKAAPGEMRTWGIILERGISHT